MHTKSHNHNKHRPHTPAKAYMHSDKHTAAHNTHRVLLSPVQTGGIMLTLNLATKNLRGVKTNWNLTVCIATATGKRSVCMCALCICIHERECVGRCNSACVFVCGRNCVGGCDCVREGAGAEAELWTASQTESAGKHSITTEPYRDHRRRRTQIKTSAHTDTHFAGCVDLRVKPLPSFLLHIQFIYSL